MKSKSKIAELSSGTPPFIPATPPAPELFHAVAAKGLLATLYLFTDDLQTAKNSRVQSEQVYETILQCIQLAREIDPDLVARGYQ